jgi:ribose/xylose/arabinose/galactoside ABC-type transport system permease subunit
MREGRLLTHHGSRITLLLRPWLSLALVCAGFSLHPAFLQTFWTREYLPNILQQAATNIILAVGMTFVILTGGIDLSVGSVLALCGVTLGLTVRTGPPPFLAFAMVFPLGVAVAVLAARAVRRQKGKAPPPPWIERAVAGAAGLAAVLLGGLVVLNATAGGIRLEGALLAALAVGGACGLLNGLVITLGRVPPFVVTLGMLTAARGLTVYATDGNSVSGLPPRLGILGGGAPLVAIALGAVFLGALLLERTRAGRYIRAIGGSEEAARLTGVNVPLYKTLAYVLSGLMAAVAAIVLTAKFRLADTGAGTNAELNAIAAVVIGGTSLRGGQGSVIGSLVGALTIAVLNAGLVLVGVRDTLQGVVIGAVIVATVMIDQFRGEGRRLHGG